MKYWSVAEVHLMLKHQIFWVSDSHTHTHTHYRSVFVIFPMRVWHHMVLIFVLHKFRSATSTVSSPADIISSFSSSCQYLSVLPHLCAWGLGGKRSCLTKMCNKLYFVFFFFFSELFCTFDKYFQKTTKLQISIY